MSCTEEVMIAEVNDGSGPIAIVVLAGKVTPPPAIASDNVSIAIEK